MKSLVITMDEPMETQRITLNLTGVTRFKNLDHFWLFDKHLNQRYTLVFSLKDNESLCIKHLHVHLRVMNHYLPRLTCLETLDIYYMDRFYNENLMDQLKGNAIRSIALHEQSMYIRENYFENRILISVKICFHEYLL